MSSVAIKIENLGKKYVIDREKGNGEKNFREVVIGTAKKIITSFNPFVNCEEDTTGHEELRALSYVSFMIQNGDKVGVIGRNGAGKSTILKEFSRISETTTEKIHINGGIGSLLVVGTGIQLELTGREHICLNGAILGITFNNMTIIRIA